MNFQAVLDYNWANLIPATALVAIVLFVMREVLEGRRRKNSKDRQVRAMKAILARECEHNYWPLRGLTEIFEFIKKEPNNYKNVRIVERATGSAVEIKDGTRMHGFLIAKFRRDRMSDMLLDVAELDEQLFELVEAAYDAIGAVDNARFQLVNIDDLVEHTGIEALLIGLPGYGLPRISEADAALKALYKECTGKQLERGRVN